MKEAGRRAGHLDLTAGELLKSGHLGIKDLVDRPEVTPLVLVGDVEEDLLGAVG